MNTNSASQYTYEELFQRNIGVFTPEEQEKIKNLKVAIAGAGGLGGASAFFLARLGVGEMRLADPEVFEVSNLNRQFGSNIDTVGMNKAEVVGNELLKINPHLKLKIYPVGISHDNADEFLEGIDIVVDGIDFYAAECQFALHEAARKRDIWVFMSQIAGSMASYIYFNPKGVKFKEIVLINDVLDIEKLILSFFPVLPIEVTKNVGIFEAIKKGQRVPIPSWSHAPVVTALLLVEDMVDFLIHGKQVLSAPDLYQLDITKRKFIYYKDGEISGNVC